MKKCIDKDCKHDLQPLEAFTHRKRYRKDGSFRIEVSSTCKECVNIKHSIRQKEGYVYSEGKSGVQTPHKHEGPKGLERMFFCSGVKL